MKTSVLLNILVVFIIFISTAFIFYSPQKQQNHKTYQFEVSTDTSVQRLEIAYITPKKLKFKIVTALKYDTCKQVIDNFAKKTKEQKIAASGLVKYDVFRYKNLKIAYNLQDPTVIFVYYMPIKLKVKEKDKDLIKCKSNYIIDGRMTITHW